MIRYLTLILLVFVSCTEKKPPKRSHTLRMNIAREPLTMDPRQGGELISSTLHFIAFEGLTRFNPDGSLTPAQAESVEISDDRKTYLFHLRNTKWSDGSPVTAHDFERAWKAILSPNFSAPNAHLLYPIKNSEKAKKGEVALDQIGVYVKDDKTLIVELENPTPYFLDLVSFCVFFPIHSKIDLEDPHWMHEAGNHFISNGPFTLKSWKHHNEMIFEKNRYYWESRQIHLDQIHVSMVSNESTALNMFENGELDLMGLGISPLPNDVILEYYRKGYLKTQASPGTSVVCFNVTKFPFHNKNIRKAFAFAIHREEIIENITQLGEEVATNIISPRLTDKIISYFKDNDVVRARDYFQKGLKELGIEPSEFPSLTYYYSLGDLSHKLAQVLQQQWHVALGIKVNLQHTEHKVLLDRLKNHNYELAQSFWVAQYNDPMSILERFKYKNNAKNYPGWEDPAYINLLLKADKEQSPELRNKTLLEAEALFMEEMPLAPLYHWRTGFMIKDYLSYQDFPRNGFLELTRISFRSE